MKVRLRRIGNSVGVVLPREILTGARLAAGDELHLVELPDGFTA